jgi:pyruvate ferredoxin oxidoreductase gamma subunit
MPETAPCVLVINRDVSLAEAIHKILAREGYRVFFFADLAQAKDRLQKEGCTLVVADLEFLEQMGEKGRAQIDWSTWPPVVFLSDYVEENFNRLLLRGFKKSSVVKKPLTREKLLEAVDQITGKNPKHCEASQISGNGSLHFTKEIRIHGRGGQGVVTAAELVAFAAFEDGKYATAFPSFGSERMGAPVQSFVRISNLPIRDRSQIQTPDIVIIQDPTLIGGVNLTKGLKPDGMIIIDTEKSPSEVGLDFNGTILTLPASKIALEKIGRPIQNTTLVGALAGATGLISWESVKKSIMERFPGQIGEKNVASAWEAFQQLQKVHAQK